MTWEQDGHLVQRPVGISRVLLARERRMGFLKMAMGFEKLSAGDREGSDRPGAVFEEDGGAGIECRSRCKNIIHEEQVQIGHIRILAQ